MGTYSWTSIKRKLLFPLITAFITFPAFAFAEDIYTGVPAEQAGIKAVNWGSGVAVDFGDKKYMGERSIKITTQGMHSGGGIEFKEPVSLNVGDQNSNEYLQFRINFLTMITLSPTGFTYGVRYGNEEYGSDISELVHIPKVSKIRFVFVSDSGKSSEVQMPVTSNEDDEGWPKINVPLAAIKAQGGDKAFKLKKVYVFTDIPDTLFIGEITTMTDSMPISSEAGDEQYRSSNEVVFFRGTAEGGASTLLYSWDFDSNNGIQEDAGGPMVLHVYRLPGEYTVTLTVKDVFGLKKPSTCTTKVEVN